MSSTGLLQIKATTALSVKQLCLVCSFRAFIISFLKAFLSILRILTTEEPLKSASHYTSISLQSQFWPIEETSLQRHFLYSVLFSIASIFTRPQMQFPYLKDLSIALFSILV